MSDLAKIAAAVSVKTLVMRVGQYAGPIGTVHVDVPVDTAAKMAAVGHVEGLTAEDAAKIADHLAEIQKEIVDRVDAALVPTTADAPATEATSATTDAASATTDATKATTDATATEATATETEATTAKVKATKAKAAPKAQAADK